MKAIRLITARLIPLLDKDIAAEYNSRHFANSTSLVETLKKLDKYKPILEEAAPLVVYNWFAQIVQERLHLGAQNAESGQFTLPGWEQINLQGAYTLKEADGSVSYYETDRMQREHFAAADDLLTSQIKADTRTRQNLRVHNKRLEPLRKVYGDLPAGELIRLAAKAIENSAPRPQDQPQAGA